MRDIRDIKLDMNQLCAILHSSDKPEGAISLGCETAQEVCAIVERFRNDFDDLEREKGTPSKIGIFVD